MTPSNNTPGNTAILYHYLAHYREAIFQKLSGQKKPDTVYTLFSGKTANIAALKTIDPGKAMLSPKEGGLRWRFVNNCWIGPILWQQGILKQALSTEFHTLIFLGDIHFLSTWIGAGLARIRGKRVLMWTHGFLSRETGIKKQLRLLFYRLSHGLLLYGNRAAHIASQMGIPRKNLYVIFNSLDYERQVTLREAILPRHSLALSKALFKNPEWPILIATCRLTKQKRLEMLILLAKNLARQGINVNVLVVGDGPERSGLTALVLKNNISDRVVFTGACHDEAQLALMIRTARLSVMPGEVGLTCLHALAYGTPVITHDRADSQMPEFEAIIQGKTGDLFRHNDQADLEKKVSAWLLKKEPEPSRRRACHRIIDQHYNPGFQLAMINRAVKGIPADRCPSGATAVKPLILGLTPDGLSNKWDLSR